MSVKVRGIVVRYNEMVGVVLLQHRTWPTLAVLAAAYEASVDDRGFWFAKFRWSAVSEADRCRIARRQSPPATGRAKHRTSRPALIRDIILGCPANCLVVKSPKWEAVGISINIDGVQYSLPMRCYSPPVRPSKRSAREGVAQRRINRLNQSRPSNIWRPWGRFGG